MKKCVYVFRITGTDYYKIGFTVKDVNRRLQAMKMYNPNSIEIFCLIKTSDPAKLEKELHGKFNKNRMNGEFFKLSSEDLEILKQYMNKDYIDFMNECHLIYQHGAIKLSQIRNLLIRTKKMEERVENGKFDYSVFIPQIKKSFKDQVFATSTEIFDKMFDYFSNEEMSEVSKRGFGIMLSETFVRKVKKINGKTKRVYVIE